MTRTEAEMWLNHLKWRFEDDGYRMLAWEADEAEVALHYVQASDLKQWVATKYGAGRKWHVRLVLARPYEARAYAVLKGILLSVWDERVK